MIVIWNREIIQTVKQTDSTAHIQQTETENEACGLLKKTQKNLVFFISHYCKTKKTNIFFYSLIKLEAWIKYTFALFFFDCTAVSNCTFQSIIVNIMSLQLQSNLRPKKHFDCFFQLFWSAVDFLVQSFSSEEINTENIHSWETKEHENNWQLHMLRISSSLGFSDMIFTHSPPSTLCLLSLITSTNPDSFLSFC